MASSNQNPNVKEIPSPSSICVRSPSIIRTASSLGRMLWLRKSAAVLRRHWRNSLTSTAPHLSDLSTERKLMSTLTQSRNEPATVQSSGGCRIGDAMNDQAWIAKAAKQPMVLETVDLGPLGVEDVEVAVEHCGLCHSDLSVLNNDWGFSQYPAILGHEVIGRVSAIGPNAKGLTVGQRVGVGWNSGRCMHCHQCMSGHHHLCPQVQFTIVGHRGGFATHIRSHWAWAFPLPEKLNFV